jgi:hypothetical protein
MNISVDADVVILMRDLRLRVIEIESGMRRAMRFEFSAVACSG